MWWSAALVVLAVLTHGAGPHPTTLAALPGAAASSPAVAAEHDAEHDPVCMPSSSVTVAWAPARSATRWCGDTTSLTRPVVVTAATAAGDRSRPVVPSSSAGPVPVGPVLVALGIDRS